jgi:hypothetical protein
LQEIEASQRLLCGTEEAPCCWNLGSHVLCNVDGYALIGHLVIARLVVEDNAQRADDPVLLVPERNLGFEVRVRLVDFQIVLVRVDRAKIIFASQLADPAEI